LLEYIGCGLRAKKGISLDRVNQLTGKSFNPRVSVKKGIEEKQFQITEENYLKLIPEEWIKETASSLEVALSFES
jgi:hypothetical protein